MKEYKNLTISREGQVATLTLLSRARTAPDPKGGDHWEIASAFDELREDTTVRVIVLTGSDGQFKVPPPREHYLTQGPQGGHNDPATAWKTFTGLIRCHQVMAEIEKPIVAKVNGDAIGFGQSLVFASDIIVAREDAKFIDHHMAGVFQAEYLGEVKQGGHGFSVVPGDGGAALVPLYMTPCKAKEYLMLAEPYTAAELARLGIINHAVPAKDLDAKVQDIVTRLLQRGAYALAWTKRVANRRVVEQLNRTLDAGAAYEMVTFLQREKLGNVEKTTLD